MSEAIDTTLVRSGTWGSLWIDGEQVAECYGCQAKISKTKESVPRCRAMMEDSKLVSTKGTGSIRIYNATSRLIELEGEALKTAVFAAALFEEFGFDVTPTSDEERFDIIQTVQLRTPEALIAFCQGMQAGAPVDSFVVPEPWDMPGYDSQVIMAAGAFTMGSSIELSADAPLREPYAAWMQGGFNFHSAKAGVMLAAQAMHDRGLI